MRRIWPSDERVCVIARGDGRFEAAVRPFRSMTLRVAGRLISHELHTDDSNDPAPCAQDHLDISLQHLTGLVTRGSVR